MQIVDLQIFQKSHVLESLGSQLCNIGVTQIPAGYIKEFNHYESMKDCQVHVEWKTTSDKIRLENGRIIKRFFVYIQFDQNLKKREKRRYVYRRRLGKGNIIVGVWPATTMEHFCIAGRDNQPMNDGRKTSNASAFRRLLEEKPTSSLDFQLGV